MKRLMAEQFENMEGAMEALDGPHGSTLVTERNKVAKKKDQRLQKALAASKPAADKPAALPATP